MVSHTYPHASRNETTLGQTDVDNRQHDAQQSPCPMVGTSDVHDPSWETPCPCVQHSTVEQQCGETTDANKMNEYELQRTKEPQLCGRWQQNTKPNGVTSHPLVITQRSKRCSVISRTETSVTPFSSASVPVLNCVHMNEMND